MELGSQISTVQNDLEVTPCQKHDMPWKNNDVNDLLFSENDVREQLCLEYCKIRTTGFSP